MRNKNTHNFFWNTFVRRMAKTCGLQVESRNGFSFSFFSLTSADDVVYRCTSILLFLRIRQIISRLQMEWASLPQLCNQSVCIRKCLCVCVCTRCNVCVCYFSLGAPCFSLPGQGNSGRTQTGTEDASLRVRKRLHRCFKESHQLPLTVGSPPQV